MCGQFVNVHLRLLYVQQYIFERYMRRFVSYTFIRTISSLPLARKGGRKVLDGRAEALGPLLFYSCLGVKADCLK